MDCAPVVISIYNTINYALWLRNMGKNIYNFMMTSSVFNRPTKNWEEAKNLIGIELSEDTIFSDFIGSTTKLNA